MYRGAGVRGRARVLREGGRAAAGQEGHQPHARAVAATARAGRRDHRHHHQRFLDMCYLCIKSFFFIG